MIVANVLTTWVEALQTLFADDYPVDELRSLPVVTEYPMLKVQYPGLWVNFTVTGDVHNAGIGHVEHVDGDDGITEVYRWRFTGVVEITVGSMGNLERALILDELSKAIAIARVDENEKGEFRRHVQSGDLVGQNVRWESFSISGFASNPGTPWGSDDVIYEATISINVEGECVLEPETGELVLLSAIVIDDPLVTGDPDTPVVGTDGWH